MTIIHSLTEAESALVRETQPDRIAGLDEDDLVELHGRVRRARDKYVKLYRREASARVQALGGRGFARPKNRRNADKAEVFEDALARVSRRLAAAARRSANELRAERLAAVRAERNAAPPRPATRTRARNAGRDAGRDVVDRSPASTPDRLRRHASTRATNARRQTRRDTRA
jgi:hypothetical protein